MEIVVLWVIAAIVVAIIAKDRNRSAFGWFLLSVLISPILALVLVLALGKPEPMSAQSTDDELRAMGVEPPAPATRDMVADDFALPPRKMESGDL